MNVRNPLEANDWDIATFFKLIVALQLSMWLLLGLDVAGLGVAILQELFVLIYLLFVAGIILLRALKLHELNPIEGLLYTVGLSVATGVLALYPVAFALPGRTVRGARQFACVERHAVRRHLERFSTVTGTVVRIVTAHRR